VPDTYPLNHNRIYIYFYISFLTFIFLGHRGFETPSETQTFSSLPQARISPFEHRSPRRHFFRLPGGAMKKLQNRRRLKTSVPELTTRHLPQIDHDSAKNTRNHLPMTIFTSKNAHSPHRSNRTGISHTAREQRRNHSGTEGHRGGHTSLYRPRRKK